MSHIIKVDSKRPSVCLERAVSVLKDHGVVALPTETFYGLAVDPFSPRALKKLFVLKKRPVQKPILVLIGKLEMLSLLVKEVPPLAKPLIARFWPGPLTLIFKAQRHLPLELTAATGTIAVRFSSHPLPIRLSCLFEAPITGTSANLSGFPPPVEASEVAEMLPGVDLILDAGPTGGGKPSTIVDLTTPEPRLVRAGKISWEEIRLIWQTKSRRIGPQPGDKTR